MSRAYDGLLSLHIIGKEAREANETFEATLLKDSNYSLQENKNSLIGTQINMITLYHTI